MQIGSRFFGSSQLTTSTSNQEIVPRGKIFYKFSFMNSQDCTVKINGSNPIFLRANQGFSMDEVDAYIHSFVIVEPNIEFNWVGGAR